ncbi:MAG: recombinase family protein [Candidatus Paceibacterota bacterium]
MTDNHPSSASDEVKYVLYARKSTESDEQQALSIDAQVKEMKRLAEKKDLNITEVMTEAHSAKAVGQRPVFNKMIEKIKTSEFTGVLTWAPDRLSRNAGDLGALVDLMDQDVLKVVQTHGQRFSDAPSEKFLLMIMGSQAKLENDQKSKNVKRGLRARCEQGLWPAPAPTGYLKHRDRKKKCHVVVDPKRAPTIRDIFRKVAYENMSGRDVYRWLKKDADFKTKNGKHLTQSNIYLILKNTFYYGKFEYPTGSDNWYDGVHEPIISKELYEKVQLSIRANTQYKPSSKEFAFTKLMKCGECGSGITVQEKIKKLKDGSERNYVYYNCTRSRNTYCDAEYIREVDLIEQLKDLIDEININELGVQESLRNELERFNSFRGLIGEDKKDTKIENVGIKEYAKYILNNGSLVEKRQVLSNLKGNIILKNGKLLYE